MADENDLTEEEIGLIVAFQKGNVPRANDPLCRALEARGMVSVRDGVPVLTPAGVSYGK